MCLVCDHVLAELQGQDCSIIDDNACGGKIAPSSSGCFPSSPTYPLLPRIRPPRPQSDPAPPSDEASEPLVAAVTLLRFTRCDTVAIPSESPSEMRTTTASGRPAS